MARNQSKGSNTSKNQKSNSRRMNNSKPNKFDKRVKDSGEFGSAYKEELSSGKEINDVSWYAGSPQLLKDAGSLSFNDALGSNIAPMPEGYKITAGPSATNKTYISVGPGIMQIDFIPTIGSTGINSPITVASNKIYSYVRHANSGSKNYDAPDLMTYLIHMNNVYMLWNWGKRAYGIATTWEMKNRYIPETLLEASGWNPIDIRENLAQLRYYLNYFASALNSICVPNTMPLFQRTSYLVSNVFKEDDTDKAQMYVFRPGVFYSANDLTPGLTCAGIVGDTTVREWQLIMQSMIRTVLNSEDLGIMSGDILKAYGSNNLYYLSPVEEGYTVHPAFVSDVLHQIHNATLVPVFDFNSYMDISITQDAGTNQLVQDIKIASTAPIPSERYLDFLYNTVEPSDVMVGSRLTCIPRNFDYDVTSKGFVAAQATYGTEIIHDIEIYNWVRPCGDANNLTIITERVPSYYKTSSTIRQEFLTPSTGTPGGALMSMAQFKYAPMIPCTDVNTVTDNDGIYTFDGTFEGFTGPRDNFTIIDYNELYRLHELAVLSEFGVGGNTINTGVSRS